VVCPDVPGVVSTLEQLTHFPVSLLRLISTGIAARISVIPEKYNRDSASPGAGYSFHFLQ
jgi:hypothetical protein